VETWNISKKEEKKEMAYIGTVSAKDDICQG